MKNLYKTIAQTIVAISFGIGTVYASPATIANGGGDKPDRHKKEAPFTAELSIEEFQLLESLELDTKAFTIDQVIEDMISSPVISEVRVYNANGELVHLQKDEVTMSAIPSSAELMMESEGVQYYFLKK